MELFAHEVGHALGFWHEHQRADRDQYVTVYPGNIDENIGKYGHIKIHIDLGLCNKIFTQGCFLSLSGDLCLSDPWQVEQKGNTRDLVPYDYGSVMHYNAWVNNTQTQRPPGEKPTPNHFCIEIEFPVNYLLTFQAFTSLTKPANTTIVPHNPLYLHTIGQKVEISFFDAKLANMAYCAGEILSYYQ